MTLKDRVAAQDRQIAQLQLDNQHLLVKIEDAQDAAAEARAAAENLTLKIVAETRAETRAGLLAAIDDLSIRLSAADIHLSLLEY